MRYSALLLGLTCLTTAIISTIATTVPAHARQTAFFFCGKSSNVPTVMARTKRGVDVPIIRFRSEYFSVSGWTPERRCQEIAQRFQSFYASDMLNYLTTGRMNGENIVCVAKTNGGACLEDGLLFTLKPGNKPRETLQHLIDMRYHKASSPINETTSRLYISIDELLEASAQFAPTARPSRSR